MFRNTCYRPAPGAVTVDEARKTILVGPVAYEYSGFCLQVVLPFQRTVDVGLLKPGQYDILQSTSRGPEQIGSLSIRPNLTDAPDDFLYAPISQAFFKDGAPNAQVTLAGEYPNSCMKIEKVIVTLEKDVVVIQPIMSYKASTLCQDGRFAFEEIVKLDAMPAGRYLIHVRSMNGNAVNNLVSVGPTN